MLRRDSETSEEVRRGGRSPSLGPGEERLVQYEAATWWARIDAYRQDFGQFIPEDGRPRYGIMRPNGRWTNAVSEKEMAYPRGRRLK